MAGDHTGAAACHLKADQDGEHCILKKALQAATDAWQRLKKCNISCLIKFTHLLKYPPERIQETQGVKKGERLSLQQAPQQNKLVEQRRRQPLGRLTIRRNAVVTQTGVPLH